VLPTVEKTRMLLEKTSQFVDKTNEFVDRMGPKVESAATDVAAIVSGVRRQAADVEAALGEILQKVEKQSRRVDDMFSGTLDAVDKASSFVTQTVGKPVRQLSGLLAGVKAAVESLRTNDHPIREREVRDERDGKDMFV
jgi:ABC-type transporter Mla subunit MlaD